MKDRWRALGVLLEVREKVLAGEVSCLLLKWTEGDEHFTHIFGLSEDLHRMADGLRETAKALDEAEED